MNQTFEDRYEAVLRNMEMMIFQVYDSAENMSDHDVARALDGLIRKYSAEARNRTTPTIKLNDNANATFGLVSSICDWHMTGESPFTTEDGQKVDLPMDVLEVSEIIDCLKRLRKSVKLWTKQGGRHGYYNFIAQFFSPID